MSAAHMVEHSVKNDLNARLVQCIADGPEFLIGSETDVYFLVITGIVTVGIGLEYR